MRILVFGPFSGFASYPVVMRGLAGAFEDHGLEVVRVDLSGSVGDLPPEDVQRLALGVLPEDLEVDHALVMKPSFQMAHGLYEAHLPVSGFFVGDVSEIPQDWKLAMRFCKQVVVPSQWMARVVENTVRDPVPVVVSNHGIEEDYIDAEVVPAPDGPPFRWLHCCSAGVYPERKGTPQALKAFERLESERGGQQLTLIVSEMRRPLKKLLGAMDGGTREKVLVSTKPQGMSVAGMIEMYRQHHALLAPSRSEGFGIQPLEARALGCPVVQTTCTGFADHGAIFLENTGVCEVAHGAMVPAWGDFGEAPELSYEDVYGAMRHMVEKYSTYRGAAEKAAPGMSRWSWFETTRALADKIKEGR